MDKHVRDNIAFILISGAAFLSEPAIVQAQDNPYSPLNFAEPMSLYRGKISPASPDAVYLDDKDRCDILKNDWGWQSCDGIEAMIYGLAPGIDTVMIGEPNSEGFVKFDDWEDADRQDEIDATWNDFVEGSRARGEAPGVLAALVGVKYGKAAATGIIAILPLFLRKAWLLLLIPFVFLKKLFSGEKETG